jgi:hypothetical protein
MPNFLVEIYAPSSSALPELIEAARAVTSEASAVRYVESIYVPEDEPCFHVFEGASAAAIPEAAQHASLSLQRVVEAVR